MTFKQIPGSQAFSKLLIKMLILYADQCELSGLNLAFLTRRTLNFLGGGESVLF